MKYISLDDKVFEANNFEDLARALWQSKFIPEASLQEWMHASASRAEHFNGALLRTDSIDNHICDMIAEGFLKRLEDD